MKVHYVINKKTTIPSNDNITACGINPKPVGLIDPFLEYDKESFFNWGDDVRCKKCSKKLTTND